MAYLNEPEEKADFPTTLAELKDDNIPFQEIEMTPYNTGKVKIGINYKPRPYIETDPDMLKLRSALLSKGIWDLFKKWLVK